MPRKREDLTGQRFGRLLVLYYDHTDDHGETFWKCKCDFGNLTTVRRQCLRSGSTISCGCSKHEPEDITGKRFGRLTAIEFAGRDGEGKTKWLCRCDCGNEVVVDAWNLKSGHTKSCGCLIAENFSSANKTHGLSKEKIYPVWKSMRARCNNPNSFAYKYYGERGISVCDEWNNDFQTFYDWAIDNGYDPSLSIDRINNDGDYSPDNCKWSTRFEQANNRRMCRQITYQGITHTMAEWARIFDVPYSGLRERIYRNNMRDFEEYFSNIKQED